MNPLAVSELELFTCFGRQRSKPLKRATPNPTQERCSWQQQHVLSISPAGARGGEPNGASLVQNLATACGATGPSMAAARAPASAAMGPHMSDEEVFSMFAQELQQLDSDGGAPASAELPRMAPLGTHQPPAPLTHAAARAAAAASEMMRTDEPMAQAMGAMRHEGVVGGQ